MTKDGYWTIQQPDWCVAHANLTTMQYSALCYVRRQTVVLVETSDIQRYHPRIYCSVKPGRQLGYKLVLCTARTATSPLLHRAVRSVCIHIIHPYTFACTIGGSSDRVYESRMFMFLAATRQNLANIGSQFNDQPIARNFPRVFSPGELVRLQSCHLPAAERFRDVDLKFSYIVMQFF